MAENKRASMNARVAVPRVNSPQSSHVLSNDDAIARAIGAKIRVILSKPSKTFEGYLFNAHLPSNTLLLTPSWPPPTDKHPSFTTLFLNNIQSMTILSPNQFSSATSTSTTQNNSTAPSASKAQFPPLSLPLLDPQSQNAKLQAAISRLEAEEARKGKGVSKEAQDIFDVLAKTLPARWEGENIVVLDQVVVNKPYRVEDVKGGKDAPPLIVQRIQKVLEAEKKKLAERGNGILKAAGAERKGG